MKNPQSKPTKLDEIIGSRYRSCNCNDEFILPDGIMRTLLERINPNWKWVAKKPCTHWITFALPNNLTKEIR